jgi:hypothetical protein
VDQYEDERQQSSKSRTGITSLLATADGRRIVVGRKGGTKNPISVVFGPIADPARPRYGQTRVGAIDRSYEHITDVGWQPDIQVSEAIASSQREGELAVLEPQDLFGSAVPDGGEVGREKERQSPAALADVQVPGLLMRSEVVWVWRSAHDCSHSSAVDQRIAWPSMF